MSEYIGWVPSITGQLDFTHCGLNRNFVKKFSKSRDLSYKDDHGFYSLIFATLNLKDESVENGNFTFFFHGKSQCQNKFSGKIYIVPRDIKFIYFLQKIDSKFDQVVKNIIDLKEENLVDEYTNIAKQLESIQFENFFSIDFCVDRFGFAIIKEPNSVLQKKDDLEVDTISRQGFYFIKYALHVHQHHDDGDDSITTTHQITNDFADAENMLNDLRGSLVKAKRTFRESSYECLFHSRGIVSYAKSLLESCKQSKDVKIKDEYYVSQLNYLNNLADSLDNIANNENRLDSITKDRISNLRSIILFFLAITAPIILIYKDKFSSAATSQENFVVNDFDIIVELIFSFYSNIYVYVTTWAVLVFYYIYLLSKRKRNSIIKFIDYSLTGINNIIKSIRKNPYKSIRNARYMQMASIVIFLVYFMI